MLHNFRLVVHTSTNADEIRPCKHTAYASPRRATSVMTLKHDEELAKLASALRWESVTPTYCKFVCLCI